MFLPRLPQNPVEFSHNACRCNVATCYWLSGHDHPSHWCRRLLCGRNHSFLKQFRIGEKQGRIPTKEHKTGDETRLRLAANVMIALDALCSAKDGGMRSPGIPEKFNDCEDDS